MNILYDKEKAQQRCAFLMFKMESRILFGHRR